MTSTDGPTDRSTDRPTTIQFSNCIFFVRTIQFTRSERGLWDKKEEEEVCKNTHAFARICDFTTSSTS